MVYTKDNRELGTAIVVGLPLLAASLFVPPLAGVAVGVVTGFGFTAVSQYDYMKSKDQMLAHGTGTHLGEGMDPLALLELKMVEDKLTERNFNLALLPVGYGIGSFMLKTAAVKLSSLSVANKIFKSKAP